MNNSVPLDDEICKFVLDASGAHVIAHVEFIQALWGGQGQLLRLHTDSPCHPHLVLKLIRHAPYSAHPRGWNTSASFARKQRSYQVESHWYSHYANRCTELCYVPRLVAVDEQPGQQLILLEDLSLRYPARRGSPDRASMNVCIDWLAAFHATFLHVSPDGLWEEGCYWHLDTRPDEFAAMQDGPVKQAAHELDRRLRHCAFRTLVHGDAKLANFCFSVDQKQVAAVDFQYTGGGCGMKDVVYLIGSCIGDTLSPQDEQRTLDRYFAGLTVALAHRGMQDQAQAIEQEWRPLYEIAWTDFYRFLLGWMPAHQKINSYTKSLAERALAQLSDTP